MKLNKILSEPNDTLYQFGCQPILYLSKISWFNPTQNSLAQNKVIPPIRTIAADEEKKPETIVIGWSSFLLGSTFVSK